MFYVIMYLFFERYGYEKHIIHAFYGVMLLPLNININIIGA